MSSTIAVVGALRVETDAEGEPRSGGDALAIAVVAARLGLEVDFVATSAAALDPAVRGPLVAEGLHLSLVPSNGRPTGDTLGGDSEYESVLRLAGRREALVCVAGDTPRIATAALREADPRRTLRVLCYEPGSRLDPAALRDTDLVIADLEVARTWCASLDDGVSARGLARRLFAFGPKRVLVLDRRGSGSVAFDGTLLLPIGFAPGPRTRHAAAAFVAAVVARLSMHDRLRQALLVGVRCAELPVSPTRALPDLPTAAALEAFAARPARS
jgi:sugar/nucleoside kinase (ribokinase family)